MLAAKDRGRPAYAHGAARNRHAAPPPATCTHVQKAPCEEPARLRKRDPGDGGAAGELPAGRSETVRQGPAPPSLPAGAARGVGRRVARRGEDGASNPDPCPSGSPPAAPLSAGARSLECSESFESGLPHAQVRVGVAESAQEIEVLGVAEPDHSAQSAPDGLL